MGLFKAHGVVEDCFLEKIKWDEIFAVIGVIIEKMPKQRREILNLFSRSLPTLFYATFLNICFG
jgi:hypothetical protein